MRIQQKASAANNCLLFTLVARSILPATAICLRESSLICGILPLLNPLDVFYYTQFGGLKLTKIPSANHKMLVMSFQNSFCPD